MTVTAPAPASAPPSPVATASPLAVGKRLAQPQRAGRLRPRRAGRPRCGPRGVRRHPVQPSVPERAVRTQIPLLRPPGRHGPVRPRRVFACAGRFICVTQDLLCGGVDRRGHRDRGWDRGRLFGPLDVRGHHAGDGHALRYPGHRAGARHRDRPGPGWLNSALAIGIGYIPIFVRVVRGPVLSLRQAGYVLAGQVLGFSRARLLFRHILPNIAGIITVQVSLALAWSVLAEASLSFLGLGPPPPTPSLGEMVSQSSSLASTAWWTLAAPSIAIIISVIGFNFLGDGLRDAVDPRSRTR